MKTAYHWVQYTIDGEPCSGSLNGYTSLKTCVQAAPNNSGVRFFKEIIERKEITKSGKPKNRRDK